MALTRRAVFVALAGVVLAAVLGGVGLGALGVPITIGVLLVGIGVDLAWAGSITAVRLARDGQTRTRLGEPVEVHLLVANGGRRRVRGELRDAWVPSAGAGPFAHRIDVPPGERRRVTTTLVPTRRGTRDTDHVVVRSVGPLGLAGRQRRHTRHVPGSKPVQTAPWSVVVTPRSPRGDTCRRSSPGCAGSRARSQSDGQVRAASSIRCGPTCRATTSARSTGAAPLAGTPWW